MATAIPYVYKVIDVGSIAAGGTIERSWTSDDDYTIERIFIIDKDGYTLYKVTVTVRIDDNHVTRDAVPAMIFGPDEQTSPVLNVKFTKGKTIYFSFSNNDSISHDIIIVMKLHKS